MSQLTFETFAAAAKARGFDEVLERKWQPSLVLDTHTHPFAVKALVVQGEMWLVVGNDERHLLPGDTFALELSAECLKDITGLTNMRYQDMDAWSQAMIDGIANYTGNKQVEARCHAATAGIEIGRAHV